MQTEDLDGSARESALGSLRSSLHEKNDGGRADGLVDGGLGLGGEETGVEDGGELEGRGADGAQGCWPRDGAEGLEGLLV